MSDRAVEQVIQRYLSSYPTRDVETRLGLFADNAVFEDPVGSNRLIGKAAIAAFFNATPEEMTAKPDLKRIVACGNEGLFHFVMTIKGLDPDPLAIEVFEVIALDEDGLIESLKAFWTNDMVRCL